METVSRRLCIGCGICAVACPQGAITIRLDERLSYRPSIDSDKCTRCGLCTKVCYIQPDNRNALAAEASEKQGAYGFPEDGFYAQGCVSDDGEYMRSASGGLLTALLKRLFQENKIDAVVHAKAVPEDGYKPLGVCALSRNEGELELGRGSFYGPVEFSKVLRQVNADVSLHHVAVVCTPCVANAIHNLQRVSRRGDKIKYVLALMCGHNANGRHGLTMLGDYPAGMGARLLTMREKEKVTQKDSFNVSVIYADGHKVIKPITNRFKPLWRSFWNAEPRCSDCVDFSGHSTDASFKDAWRFQPIKHAMGESVFVARKEDIARVLQQMNREGIIRLKDITRDALITSQWTTIKERYYNALRLSGKREHLFLQAGYAFCRVLKKLAIGVSGHSYGKVPVKMQLVLAAVTGKLLAGFARFTNERRKSR